MTATITIDYLPNLPVVATAGSCVAYDRRPMFTDIYFLAPTSANSAQFYVIDAGANTISKLTPPALTAASIVGAGTTMCYDETMGRVWLYNAQSSTASGREWASWQYYDVAYGDWFTCDVASLALSAPWSVDAALVHTDGDICVGQVVGGQPADDHVYLCGNDATNLYRYSISADTWTIVAGSGGVREGTPGAGTNLIWNEWNNDQILSWRGRGSNLLDVYTISTDTWSAGITPNPPLICTTGFQSASLHANGSTSLVSTGGVIYALDHTSYRVTPLATIYGSDGTPHLGNGLFYYRTGGVTGYHVGFRVHSSNRVQRIKLEF